MGYVNPAPITALYNNTTPGVAADPQAMDNAVGAIVDAVNANYDTAQTTNADFSGHKQSSTLDHPDGSVTTTKIRDGNVTTPKLPDAAITTPKIAPRNVTKDRIAIGAVGYQEIDPTLTTLIPNVAIQAKFQDLDAQLAEKPSQEELDQRTNDIINSDKISNYALLPVNADATSELEGILIDLEGRVRLAYVDQGDLIDIEQPLAQNNVLLYGKAKIGKIHANNAFYYVSNSLSSFVGKYNNNCCKFAQFKDALTETRAINITVWGDSISTNGDYIGINGSNPSGVENAPDTIMEGDGYTSYLYDMVSAAMPSVVFNFYNRSIGGTRITEWNDDKTINSVTKAWIEHIKDTAPDVLVIAFGMNHNTYDRTRDIAYQISQIVNYMTANFANVPDLVFVTAPRCAYQPTFATWGSFEQQASRQMAANIFRNNAPRHGAYLMDVNRCANVRRSGTDFFSPAFQEFDPTRYINKAKTGGNYVFTGAADAMRIMRYQKDFVLKFTVTWSDYAANGDNLTISFGRTQDAGFNNNQVVITPQHTTLNQTRIAGYCNIADNTHYPNSGRTATKSLGSVMATLNLRIEKKDGILEVHREVGFGQELYIRDRVDVWDTTGFIVIQHNGVTSGFTTTISNFRMFEPVYESYLPDLTEAEAWGQFVNGDYGVKAPYGGNGANHPSDIGVKMMYAPCVQEFADDLKQAYLNS